MSDVQVPDSFATQRNWAMIVYVLYLLSAVSGVTGLIGVIMAHIKVNEAEPIWRSHFAFQIRTFWWALLFTVISVVLMIVIVGFVLLALVGIWFIVRVIIGLLRLAENRPIPAPHSLLFGL